jgi:hypothetical protein
MPQVAVVKVAVVRLVARLGTQAFGEYKHWVAPKWRLTMPTRRVAFVPRILPTVSDVAFASAPRNRGGRRGTELGQLQQVSRGYYDA